MRTLSSTFWRKAGLAALIGLASTSHAETVAYNFGGVVAQSFLPQQFAIGSTFSGSFAYDTLAHNISMGPPSGIYLQSASISVTMGGIAYYSTVPSQGRTTIYNDSQSPRIRDLLQINDDAAISASASLDIFGTPVLTQIEFKDSTMAAFNSTALPPTLDLTQFDGSSGTLRVRFRDARGGPGGDVLGTITSLSPAAPVPEPETYALMLAGLSLVGWAARRRQHAAC